MSTYPEDRNSIRQLNLLPLPLLSPLVSAKATFLHNVICIKGLLSSSSELALESNCNLQIERPLESSSVRSLAIPDEASSSTSFRGVALQSVGHYPAHPARFGSRESIAQLSHQAAFLQTVERALVIIVRPVAMSQPQPTSQPQQAQGQSHPILINLPPQSPTPETPDMP